MQTGPPPATDVVIIGAGLAGLSAALVAERLGLAVQLLDKGTSVGGRLATRRIGGARIDHGAQFFTVRGEDFATVVAEAERAGVVGEWTRGFGAEADGHPRYRATEGMNAFAKWLSQGLLTPAINEIRVDRVGASGAGIEAHTDDGARYRAPTVVLTAPVPQSLELLRRGGLRLPGDVDADLRAITYFSTIALLVTLDRPAVIDAIGGEQHDDGPFTFVADNQRKGISTVPALTAHADHDYSARRFDDDPDAVLAELLASARPWIGPARVLEAQLKKWRYAGPVNPHPERAVVIDVAGGRLIFAGDAFGGPKVEGAFNSGRAAGEAAGGR